MYFHTVYYVFSQRIICILTACIIYYHNNIYFEYYTNSQRLILTQRVANSESHINSQDITRIFAHKMFVKKW